MGDEKKRTEEIAAAKQVDPDRLLEGEDPATSYIDDAAHWVTVYSELLLFKERLVDTAQQSMLQISEPVAREEVGMTDLMVLAAERERLQKRLVFWKDRQRSLSGRN